LLPIRLAAVFRNFSQTNSPALKPVIIGSAGRAAPFTKSSGGGKRCSILAGKVRMRRDRLQAFHYFLIRFLNSNGYDFQHTDEQKMFKLLANQPRKNKVVENLKAMIARMHQTAKRK